MNCFYHPETVAVGICKNCQRGLCLSCAAELTNGIACGSRCEAAVEVINDVMERNRQVYQKSASIYVGMGWAMLILGIPVLIVSILSASKGNTGFAVVNSIFAVSMLGMSYVSFRGAKQMKNKD